jgi:hypothetical protein
MPSISLRGALSSKPHLSRYWLTPAYEADFDDKVTDINKVYKQAPERAKQGQRTESISSSRKGLNMVYLALTKETKEPCPSPRLKITESCDLNKC